MEQRVSSSMAVHLLLRRARFRLFLRRGGWRAACLASDNIVWRITSDLLDRTCDAAQWRAEVRKVDHRKQQSCDPEQVHMGEQRQEPQHSDDLELQLLRFVSHPLGQRVQFQIQVANRQDGDNQEDAHHHHPDVRFDGRSDETGQMVGSQWMKLIAQMFLHVLANIRSRNPAPPYKSHQYWSA